MAAPHSACSRPGAQHEEIRGAARGGFEQPRLAHSRLSVDDQRRAPSPPRVVQKRLQKPQLLGSSTNTALTVRRFGHGGEPSRPRETPL